MLSFSYTSAWRTTYDGNIHEEAWLKRLFTFTDLTDTRHKARMGYFPTVCTLDTTNKTMSHGQVIWAVKEGKKANISLEVHDPTKRYIINSGPIPEDYLPEVHAYDYQRLATQIALAEGHGIVNMATSSGKTVCIGMAVKALAATDCLGILILI